MTPATADSEPGSRIRRPSLLVAVTIMVACTLYPPMMTGCSGKADHWLAAALFAAMSTGFVHGVGYVPRALVWRCVFSGWSCIVSLGLAVWMALLNASCALS